MFTWVEDCLVFALHMLGEICKPRLRTEGKCYFSLIADVIAPVTPEGVSGADRSGVQ